MVHVAGLRPGARGALIFSATGRRSLCLSLRRMGSRPPDDCRKGHRGGYMRFKYGHGGAVLTLGMVMVAGCGMDEAAAPSGPGVQLEDTFSKTGSLKVNMAE